jgi:hypothetical protein
MRRRPKNTMTTVLGNQIGGRKPAPERDRLYTGAKGFLEVAAVELLLRFFGNSFEGLFEATDRIVSAFGVRIVAGKQKQILPHLAN